MFSLEGCKKSKQLTRAVTRHPDNTVSDNLLHGTGCVSYISTQKIIICLFIASLLPLDGSPKNTLKTIKNLKDFFLFSMLDVTPNKPVLAEDGNMVIYFNLHLRLKSYFISLVVHPLSQWM